MFSSSATGQIRPLHTACELRPHTSQIHVILKYVQMNATFQIYDVSGCLQTHTIYEAGALAHVGPRRINLAGY